MADGTLVTDFVKEPQHRPRLAFERSGTAGPDMDGAGMTGVGVKKLARGKVCDQVTGGDEKRRAVVPQNAPQRAVQIAQQHLGAGCVGGHFLHERTSGRGDQGSSNAVPHHVANENAHLVTGDFVNIKKIAAHRRGRLKEMVEAHRLPAFVEKRGETLRQHGELEFTGHRQLLLQRLVFVPKLIGKSGQLFLRVFALGGVPREPECADDPAAFIAQRHFAGGNVGHVPVGPELFFLNVDHRQTSIENFALVRQCLGCVFVEEQIKVGFSKQHLGVAHPMPAHHCLVDGDDPAVHVFEIDAVRKVIHQRGEHRPLHAGCQARGLFVQCRLARAAHSKGSPASLPVYGSAHQDAVHASVDPLDAVFPFIIHAALHRRSHGTGHMRTVAIVDPVQEIVRRSAECARRHAKERVHAIVPHHRILGKIPFPISKFRGILGGWLLLVAVHEGR